MSHLQATHLAIREKITVLPLFGTLYVRKTFPGILERKLKNATERIKNSLEWPAIEPLFGFYPLIYASLSLSVHTYHFFYDTLFGI
jgi:hypothetical protein